MNNNNSLAVVVLGLIGFLALVIVGKWLIDNNRRETERCQPPPVVQNQPVQPIQPQENQPDINININQKPLVYPQYHDKDEFWFGYRDGYVGRPPFRPNREVYMAGYRVGVRDRNLGRHHYYDQHCPPGFHLRVPGFRLDIR